MDEARRVESLASLLGVEGNAARAYFAALPAMIGRETIALMKDASWESLEAGVKIPRSRVYQLLLRAFAGRFG